MQRSHYSAVFQEEQYPTHTFGSCTGCAGEFDLDIVLGDSGNTMGLFPFKRHGAILHGPAADRALSIVVELHFADMGVRPVS